jgi:hypothetical protein
MLPPDYQSKARHVDWQYDEIEMAETQPPTWRQSVLFSNSWEITLHFRDVVVDEAEALLPAPATVPEAGQPPSQSVRRR